MRGVSRARDELRGFGAMAREGVLMDVKFSLSS
jgi:hypothetical protein